MLAPLEQQLEPFAQTSWVQLRNTTTRDREKRKPKVFPTQNCVGWGAMTISLHHLTKSGDSVRNYDLYNKCLAVITWSQCHWPANQDNATASQTAEIDKHQKIPTHTHISEHQCPCIGVKVVVSRQMIDFQTRTQYIWHYMAVYGMRSLVFGSIRTGPVLCD